MKRFEFGRVYNFGPGPATLPLDVLKSAQTELLNYEGTGMSMMEISHRSPTYDRLHNRIKADILTLMGLGDDYDVLFIQGGASLQFAMIPMNFATVERKGAYVLSGVFSSNAYKEAATLGVGSIAASSKEENFRRVPTQDELSIDPSAAYLHICYNNTIYGTEFHYIPEVSVPLIADMSSDMLSRPLAFNKFDLIYAGVQKNLGPAGVVVVVVRRSMVENIRADLPTMLRYDTFIKKNSMYNTPPVWSIYMVGKVVRWIMEQGGLASMAERNARKAKLLYDVIDGSDGFYRGHAEPNSRSFMNVTFRLPTEELEKQFTVEAADEGLVGVKGHRLVGGMRASIYNAMPLEGAEALADFMSRFRRAH
ncbi:MAG: 3-phosphoserine/phosphohydroxythreonine transaminase [Selenomonadaceae bacterium]|nr:3-phosphoserine/phosphohydroxythreonine transaminase [Selenomonadaceae bacterium]